MWVLFTSKGEVFFYDKGYLRTSSSEYDLKDDNNYTHLTNNCLQQHGDDYGKYEDGNTIGFEAFQIYLDQNFPQYNLNVQEHFIPRMKDLVIDTFLSIKKQLNGSKRENSFELLGYDFLVDEDFRIWLIEVNSNPYLGIPNSYIRNLLPIMIDDMFRIVLDPVFPESERTGHSNDNLFDLIYSPGNTNNSAVPINKRRSFELTHMYPVPELQDDSIGKRISKIKENHQKRIGRIGYKGKVSNSIDQDMFYFEMDTK